MRNILTVMGVAFATVVAGILIGVGSLRLSPPLVNSTNRVLRAYVAVGGGGSGTVLQRGGRTWVLTAQHCVYNPRTGELRDSPIVSRDGTNYTAIVVAHSEEEDLALLLLDENILGDVTFADPDISPPLGTPLMHAGNLMGRYPRSFVTGILSGYDRVFDGKNYWQTSVDCFPGSSGGGMYLLDGRYVGMLTRGDAPTLNFIIPVHRVYAWAVANDLGWLFDPTKPVIVIVNPLINL